VLKNKTLLKNAYVHPCYLPIVDTRAVVQTSKKYFIRTIEPKNYFFNTTLQWYIFIEQEKTIQYCECFYSKSHTIIRRQVGLCKFCEIYRRSFWTSRYNRRRLPYTAILQEKNDRYCYLLHIHDGPRRNCTAGLIVGHTLRGHRVKVNKNSSDNHMRK